MKRVLEADHDEVLAEIREDMAKMGGWAKYCRLTGIDQAALSRCLNGKGNVPPKLLERLNLRKSRYVVKGSEEDE